MMTLAIFDLSDVAFTAWTLAAFALGVFAGRTWASCTGVTALVPAHLCATGWMKGDCCVGRSRRAGDW